MRRPTTTVLGPLAATVTAAVGYTLACPPYDVTALAWLVPGALLTGTRRLPPVVAAAYGLVFAVGVGIGVTGWARDAAMAYFGLGAGAATAFVGAVWLVYGVPYGLLCACYAWLGERTAPIVRPLVGAWLWAVTEALRGALVAGVPWELLGQTQYEALWLIQIADLGGVAAVSFVIAFVSCSVAETLRDYDNRPTAGALAIQRLLPAILLLTAAMVYGFHGRLQHGARDGMVSRRVAVVQGAAPTHGRWLDGVGGRGLATYTTITRRLRDQRPDLVVWPENAVDGAHEPLLRRRLAAVAAEMGEPLLVGARRPGTGAVPRDAAYLLDARGALREISDELDPAPVAAAMLRAADERRRPVAGDAFLLGAASRRQLGHPEVARDLVGQGADLLVSLGDAHPPRAEAAPHARDLSVAVFRAIETRRYLVRAASAGPSGFVDPTGARYAMLEPGRTGATVGHVGPRTELTPYVRFGDAWLVLVGLVVGATLAAVPRRSRA